MASVLLKESDFRGEVDVPGTERPEVCSKLARFIESYEPEFMRAALGPAFAAEVYSQAALTSGRLDQFDKLITGEVNWTDADGDVHYLYGLKHCLVRFVYFFFSRASQTITTQSGEKKQSTDNSVDVPAAQKQAQAWNQMSEGLLSVWQFLDNYQVDSAAAFATYDAGRPLFRKFQPINALSNGATL